MKPRILIVEDSPEMSELLSTICRAQGWDVEVAENGEIGLEMARAFEFDVISTDNDMPKMSGLMMTAAIRQKKKHLPIFMFSSSRAENEFLMAGGTEFFEKPEATEYLARLKAKFNALNDELCGCEDCEEEDCWRDCDREEECRGCREGRQEREDTEFEIDRALGRR